MTDDRPGPAPPDGFEAMLRRGPFSIHNGPYFERKLEPGAGVEHAFFILRRHCNQMSILHGGMLSAFMDGLLAAAVARAARMPVVTVQMNLNFLSMARAGDWVTGRSHVTRLTREVAFVEGVTRVGERDLAHASAVFKLMRKRAEQGA